MGTPGARGGRWSFAQQPTECAPPACRWFCRGAGGVIPPNATLGELLGKWLC